VEIGVNNNRAVICRAFEDGTVEFKVIDTRFNPSTWKPSE
jgi:hypothetical protein